MHELTLLTTTTALALERPLAAEAALTAARGPRLAALHGHKAELSIYRRNTSNNLHHIALAAFAMLYVRSSWVVDGDLHWWQLAWQTRTDGGSLGLCVELALGLS